MKKYIAIALLVIFFGCTGGTVEEVTFFSTSSAGVPVGAYHTLQELYAGLNTLKRTYPENVTLFSIGKSKTGNYSIPLIRLSFGEDEQVSHYLFVAGTHGDEAVAVEALLYSAKTLLAQKEEIAAHGRNISADFLLVHNPDGYSENKRENASGIDLNRNFPIGENNKTLEPENQAVINLINSTPYKASLFFHSANEKKYENLIRVPLEYRKTGISGLKPEAAEKLQRLAAIVQTANTPSAQDTSWRFSSTEVNKPGIASDWCVSGFIGDNISCEISESVKYPHPSLTIELSFPKQPLEAGKLKQEKEEGFHIIKRVLTAF